MPAYWQISKFMCLAIVELNSEGLRIQRQNKQYLADMRSGFAFWLASLAAFVALGLTVAVIDADALRRGGTPPFPNFLSVHNLIFWIILTALVLVVNSAPALKGLRAPRLFEFDRFRNAFVVGGRKIGSLDSVSIRLQDSFGPNRRAVRIVAIRYDTTYVIAETQRITVPTVSGKDYFLTNIDQATKPQRRYRRWADYAGSKTGFDPAWPEYREIFALYDRIKEYIGEANMQA